MANINLHQSFERGEEMRKKPSFFKSRTFISLAILIVFSGAYFSFKYYQFFLNNKKQALIDSKKQEVTSIDRSLVGEMIDFNKKAEDISANLEEKNDPQENLSKLEQLVLDDVYLNQYNYDHIENLVKIEAVSGSLQSIAEQMLNFKRSGYFSDIEISSTQRNEEGQLIFGLEMRVAK